MILVVWLYLVPTLGALLVLVKLLPHWTLTLNLVTPDPQVWTYRGSTASLLITPESFSRLNGGPA